MKIKIVITYLFKLQFLNFRPRKFSQIFSKEIDKIRSNSRNLRGRFS